LWAHQSERCPRCLLGAIYKASARIFDLISLPELWTENWEWNCPVGHSIEEPRTRRACKYLLMLWNFPFGLCGEYPMRCFFSGFDFYWAQFENDFVVAGQQKFISNFRNLNGVANKGNWFAVHLWHWFENCLIWCEIFVEKAEEVISRLSIYW